MFFSDKNVSSYIYGGECESKLPSSKKAGRAGGRKIGITTKIEGDISNLAIFQLSLLDVVLPTGRVALSEKNMLASFS